MKGIVSFMICFFSINFLMAQNTGVSISASGNPPDASAMLDIQSSDKGLLIPRMNATQRININNPAEGLIVFDTDDMAFMYFNGTIWAQLGSDHLGNHVLNQNLNLDGYFISGDGDNEGLTIDADGKVGIGKDNPQNKLDILGHLRMEDGNQSNGMLMVSDSNGVASWKSIGSVFANSIPIDFSCIEIQGTVGSPNRSEIEYYNGYAYVLSTTSGDDEILIYDLSDPNLPLLVNSINTNTISFIDDFRAIKIHNGHLYVFNTEYIRQRISVWDLTVPASPLYAGGSTYIGAEAYDGFHDLDASGNNLFLLYDEIVHDPIAARFNIAMPNSPDLMYEVLLNTSWEIGEISVGINNSYGFACDANGIVHAFSLANPNVSVGTLNLGTPVTGRQIVLKEDFLYINNNTSNEIVVVDVNNILAMSVVGAIATTNDVGHMHINGDYLYLTESSQNNMKVINISSPLAPIEVSSIYLGATATNGQVVVNGNYAYASVGNGTSGSLDVIQLSCNSTQGYNPLSGDIGPASAFSLEETLFIGNDANGMQIKNLANPTEAQDAATKAYVDSSDDDHQSLANVLQISNDASGNQIKNVGEPTINSDVATKHYVDTSDEDNQTLANVLNYGNDAGAKRIHNILDPWAPQDVATKAYVDNSDDDHQTLENVLTQGNSANGMQIKSLTNPTDAQDAATKDYVDNNDNQTLTFTNSTLAIQDGNSVDLGITYAFDNIGIGTDTPNKARLQVEGSFVNDLPWVGYLNGAGDIGEYDPPQWFYSIYASHTIAGVEFHAHSDRRIKNIIGKSKGENDLKTIMEIEVTDYKLKDSIKNNNTITKKVIAQQVAEVYPQAVQNKTTETVPDIFKRAKVDKGWILLETNLVVGERVKIITENKEEIYEVIQVDKDRFKVSEFDGDKQIVFVYGREVNDFHTVDYEAISMLNVSATQEQQRRIEELEKENKELKAQFQALKSMMEELKKAIVVDSEAHVSSHSEK